MPVQLRIRAEAIALPATHQSQAELDTNGAGRKDLRDTGRRMFQPTPQLFIF